MILKTLIKKKIREYLSDNNITLEKINYLSKKLNINSAYIKTLVKKY